MLSFYVKLIPLVVSCSLLVLAFRVHERFWALGFSGWKRIYLGLAAIVLGSLAGIFFEFSELRIWQEALGWPVDWVILSVLASLGAAFILWGSVERLSLAAKEKEDLDLRREAFELFDGLRDAAQGPYSFLEILNFSLKEIMRKVDADAGAIWLLHPSAADYILASTSGFALPLQQKLERMPAAHAGFSRLAEGRMAREITGAEALRHWFPEFCSPEVGYLSLIGVPLVGGYGQTRHRESLGLLVLCSRDSVRLGPADTKMIGSAVTFLAGTIAEARANRLARSQQRAYDQLRTSEDEFSTWTKTWSDNGKARQRLQAAIAGLAEQVGDFVGCGRYVAGEDRWEPLALASAFTEKDLLGKKDFRLAAAEAIRSGKETTFGLSSTDGEGENAVGYRMVPVRDPRDPERAAAVLFLPIVEDVPEWWDRAIGFLAELTRVVLAIEDTVAGKMPALSMASKPAFEWAALGHMMEIGMRGRPNDLPDILTEGLPEGWRMALWQSTSARPLEYHLRLAAGKGCPPKYCSVEELDSAPLSDQIETNAHLGGLVRIHFTDSGVLTGIWPDFGPGWHGERFPAIWQPKNWGWITFYQKAEQPEVDGHQLSFLRSLAGLTELIISHHSSPVPGQTGEPLGDRAGASEGVREAEDPLSISPLIPSARLPLDRVIAEWVARQPTHIRLGRLEFEDPAASVPLVAPQSIQKIMTWGAGNLLNGLLESEHIAVNVRKKKKQISIILSRPDPAPGASEGDWAPPVQVAPVDTALREALQSCNVCTQIINSPSGPHKFILNFNPAETGDQPGGAARNILVVEDQELIRDLLLGMLEVLGYRANSARSVEDALHQFATGDFDTVITGQDRPGTSAVELAEQIKLRRPHTRVILVKELGLADSVGSSGKWVDSVLSKPFRIDELRAVLEVTSVSNAF